MAMKKLDVNALVGDKWRVRLNTVMNFRGFKKSLNFWLVEELEAFPKGLSSMELLSYVTYFCPWGRDSVVSTASRFGLEIKSRWGWDIMRQSGKVWNPNTFLHCEYRIIPSDKATGESCWPPTTSIAEVKERVELYTSVPLCTFMAFYRVKLYLYL
jgi:hypothetical protein